MKTIFFYFHENAILFMIIFVAEKNIYKIY